jgi:drug/metabolite transporter (DMT)-like permease
VTTLLLLITTVALAIVLIVAIVAVTRDWQRVRTRGHRWLPVAALGTIATLLFAVLFLVALYFTTVSWKAELA